MANLLHTKGSRTQIYKTLPSNFTGNDGDIIISTIQGRGVYLCSKVNGKWFVSNKLEELRKIEKTSIKDLEVNRLKIDNATITKNEYDVSVGDFTLDVAGDIILSADGDQIKMDDGTATIFTFDVGSCRLTISDDANIADFFRIVVGAEGATNIVTYDADTEVAHLTLAPDGNLLLQPSAGRIAIDAGDGLYFDGGTHTYIRESGDDILDFYVGTDKMLALDEANDKITMGATNWVAGTVSAGTVTEFSAANSAYAGMILGYTDIGLNEADATLNLTTSYVVPTDEFGVTFTAPPSGNVEIFCQIGWDAGTGNTGDCYAGLSTANATSGYSALSAIHEVELLDGMSRGALRTIRHSWTLISLTPGTSYTYYIGFKTTNTGGTPHIQWGSNATGEYPDFIMKATALPATIST
jgi:hypothetical protein